MAKAETGAPACIAEKGARQAAAIVACGGVGARFSGKEGRGFPEKQFIELAGKPVLAHTLDVLERHPGIALVVLVLPGQLLAKGEALANGLWPAANGTCYPKVRAILAGGEDRVASVANGLSALGKLGWDGMVLVQDGVRPCTPDSVYDRVIGGVLERGNAVAAIRIRDTIKRADSGGTVLETLDRRDLWQIQTPQGFWMRDLAEAYRERRRPDIQTTDDAALVEAMGQPVHLVEGDPVNIKLTWPEDMALLEAILRRR